MQYHNSLNGRVFSLTSCKMGVMGCQQTGENGCADDKQIRSHLRTVQLHEAIMRTLLEQEKWFVTKYYDEGYALAALPNLPDSPYQEASRSTMSNVKKRILSKADNFLTEMATCLRI